MIRDAGLIVGAVSEQNSTESAGTVIGQSPGSGQIVVENSPVDIVVSLGPTQVTVPNVEGQWRFLAWIRIRLAGLTVGNVTFENSGTVPERFVISQNPIGGSSVDEGSAVDLVVSLGPANQNPVFSQPEDDSFNVEVGMLLEIAIQATDPDGDPVTLACENLPEGAACEFNDNGTGTFSWTPEADQAGTVNPQVTFIATDDQESPGRTELAVGITVEGGVEPAVETFIGGQFKTMTWKEIIKKGEEGNNANTFTMEAEHTTLSLPVLTGYEVIEEPGDGGVLVFEKTFGGGLFEMNKDGPWRGNLCADNVTAHNRYEKAYDGELGVDVLRLTTEFSTTLYQGRVRQCRDTATGNTVPCCKPRDGGMTYDANVLMTYEGVPKRRFRRNDESLLRSRKGSQFVLEITLTETEE